MTQDDAIVYLRTIRQEYVDRLHVGINPKKSGDWINPNQRAYYQTRIEALDVALVSMTVLTSS